MVFDINALNSRIISDDDNNNNININNNNINNNSSSNNNNNNNSENINNSSSNSGGSSGTRNKIAKKKFKSFKSLRFYLYLFFYYGNISIQLGLTVADEIEYNLTRNLLNNYDPSVRPARNYSESLQVIFGVSLHHIIDVDEKNQILTTNCWITHLWTDYQLEWNVTEYSGIKVIRIPYDKVWRPDIILYNNADSQYNQAVINTNVIVSHTGLVLWLSHGIYRSSCDIDVEYFPFDVQSCTLKWASWTYDGYQLDLNKQSEEGDTSNYKANGEFDLVSFDIMKNVVNYSCCAEPYPDITYTIRLRRRPMFYVFNLILPCILINCIALLVFYVPSESGEKVTLGISALLSMTVFLMTIRETLPPTEKTPLISMYYGVSICLVTFASGLSVVTLNVYHRGVRGTKVPRFIKQIVLEKLSKLLLLQFEPIPVENVPTNDNVISARRDRIYSLTKFLDVKDNDNVGRLANKHQHIGGGGEKGGAGRRDYSPPIFETNRERSNNRQLSPTCDNTSNSFVKTNSTDTESQFLMTLNHVRQSIERNELRLTEHESRELTEREWKQVSLVCDRLLLVIFMIATVVTTVVILCGSPYGP